MKAITDVLVVGDDCDGLLAAISLKVNAPGLSVQVVRSPMKDDLLLEGFATSPAFVKFLHEELRIPPVEFLRGVGPTWRLGTRYEWGPREFFDYTCEFQVDTKYALLGRETGFYLGDSPRAFEGAGVASALMSANRAFLPGNDGMPQINLSRVAYHIERESLLRFLQTLAQRHGVNFIDGEITEVVRGEAGISCIELDGSQLLRADLFIDATGRQALLLGALPQAFQSFAPGLPCDRAMVATAPRQSAVIQPHSTVHTLEAGWSWRTEHERFIACGHAFSSRHISAKQAGAQLRELYPECGPVRQVTLQQGRCENAWLGNVIGIGAAAAFVEPLAAAGPATVAFQCRWLARTLVDCDGLIRPSLLKQFNKQWRRLVDGERDFLGLFYRFNNRLHTPFWQEARQNAYVGELETVVRSYQDIGPNSLHRSLMLYEQDPIGLEGYFSVLVGQSVPWSTPWQPSADELAKWATIANNWRRSAATGLTVNQSSELLLGRAPVVLPQPQMRFLQTVA